MTLYCAIDLHSTNNVPVIIDDDDKVLFQKRLPNDLTTVINALMPFQAELQSVAVESTFNWYWLVDGLMANGFPVELVNPAAVKQYDGIKHTNDESDAFFLTKLMRLNILPTGYIYPKVKRAIRDLLRKRLQLVRHRVSHMLSAQNQIWRTTGIRIASKRIKEVDYSLLNLIEDRHIRMAIRSNLRLIESLSSEIQLIESLSSEIQLIESTVLNQCQLQPEFQSLLTIHGVGKILGMTIMLEVGDIRRFQKVGNFASYCRCVDSSRLSNRKKKGSNNGKNGNKYLSWAFVEAAHSIIRYNKIAHRFYQKKRSQKNGALATKALAHKLARAAYFIMRDQQPFQQDLLFR